MIVYADAVMVLNFLVDFLLILGTNKINGDSGFHKRAILGGIIGAVYSGICLIPQLAFLSGELWRIICLLCISTVSFGWNKGLFRRMITFLLLSMTLGGLAMGIGSGSFGTILVCCLVIFLLIQFGIVRVSGQKYVNVELACKGQRLRIRALQDTGNMLRDPITGKTVIITGPDVAWKLFGITKESLVDPICCVAQANMPGLRLVPYRGVGQIGGMLVAAKVDKIVINGKSTDALVAFAPNVIGGLEFEALVGGAI